MAKYLLLDRAVRKTDDPARNPLNIKTLEPDSKTRIYFDNHSEAPKGFALRVTPTGNKAWILNYYVQGRERRMTLEKGYPAWGPAKARNEATKLKVRINAGEDILGERQAKKAEEAAKAASGKPENLRQLDARYRKYAKKVTARESVLKWWITEMGDLPLADVDSSLIVRKLEKLAHENTSTRTEGKRRSPATVNRYLAYLSIVLSYGVSIGVMQFNPAKGIKRNKERPRVRYLGMEGYPDDEAEKLLEACKNQNATLYALVVTAMNTGARAGELRNLEWSDINFKEESAVLRETKNDETRYIPITGKAKQVLKGLRGGGAIGKVFRSDDGSRDYDYTKDWAAAIEKAEIADFRFHDLRHHAASMLAMNGIPLNQIAHLLGHKSIQVTQRYAHLCKKNITDLGAMLDGMNFK